ncbi:potassium-transporting ATPase subunit KdpC [Peterkaempfera bronchialis]|uniref:Potassium-transporting ATPase KdpC subunit n=1 Tax=Peterkaempfera bronchialis TaxID=2126346 RepID=A0A345SRA9_9ACTN|nr:potassium-transporting ATPase subunit KdpC [Peterkaempfera bronchialis]AXI76264.1 potassium-transporting ATPase subunit KdpC [Peterkaempfera bronchialis]
MSKPLPTALRSHLTALRMLLVMTVLLGLAYPLLITGAAQAVFTHQANGSLVQADGRTVGSSLIGQRFDLPGTSGRPDPRWFQPRPSAAGYNPTASGASNLGPNSADLARTVRARRDAVAAFDGVTPSRVPADAVTASGSGLDPDISPAYAREQVNRVARARALAPAAVARLVEEHIRNRPLGFLGNERVNVLELNRALAALR